MKTAIAMAHVVVLLCLSSMSYGSDFAKIAFDDPYDYLLKFADDTTGLELSSYFYQMDSIGINLSVGIADAVSTNPSHGIKMLAVNQYREIPFLECQWASDDLRTIITGSHYAVLQAESADGDSVLSGYWWGPQGGTQAEVFGRDAYYFDPASDSPDTVLNGKGRMLEFKYERTIGCFLPYIQLTLATDDNSAYDTLCSITLSCEQDTGDAVVTYALLGTDFSASNSWEDFEFGPLPGVKGGGDIDIAVYWYGNKVLVVDEIRSMCGVGRTFANISDEELDTIIQEFNTSTSAAGVEAHFLSDEPYAAMCWGIKRFQDHSLDAANGTPKRAHAQLNRWFDTYVANADPEEIAAHGYRISGSHDSATTGSATTPICIQDAYDGLDDVMRNWGVDLQAEEELPVWFYIQAGAWGSMRNPTPNEMRVQEFMAVMHGLRGVGYFPYVEMFNDGLPKSPSLALAPQPAPGGDAPLELSAMKDYYTSPMDPNATVAFTGLVDWDTTLSRYVPNERWYAVGSANEIIDAIWPLVDTLEWHEVAKWTSVQALGGMAPDSVYSTTFDDDKTWVDVARFTTSLSDEYLMILNRRSLSSDSQAVVLEYWNTPGAVEVYDVLSGETAFVYDSAGTVRATVELQPAELKMFKVTHRRYLSGSLNGTMLPASTIDIVGDVTVDQNDTLTVQTTEVNVLSYADSLSGGVDEGKVEFAVSGMLRVEGTAYDPVVFDSDTESDSTWYGIRALSGSKIYIENAKIRNAYSGLRLQHSVPDTVLSTSFENCYTHGIYTTNDSAYIRLCEFTHDTERDASEAYGIYYHYVMSQGAHEVSRCKFENVKRPIYSDWSRPVIDSCFFRNTDTALPITAAIECPWGLSATITNSVFVSYGTGVSVGNLIYNGLIDACTFRSDTGNYYTVPRMSTGVMASNYASTVKIRNCCFGAIEEWGVHQAIEYAPVMPLDCGNSSDSGNNHFVWEFMYTLNEVPPKTVSGPAVFIENSDTSYQETMLAKGNYFDSDHAGPFLVGQIDTAGSTIMQLYTCAYTEYQGGGGDTGTSKIASPTTLPIEFAVSQNYPNPFNPSTTIPFSIPEPVYVSVGVWNILGQQVAVPFEGMLGPGEHTVVWDGRDDDGDRVASGVYFFRVTAGQNVANRKMLMLK